MPEPRASEFVQPPKQARSQRTLERIASAALELIAEQGVEATTVAQIVSRAGSSIGSFYARFEGKHELMHYLEERVWSDARARWDDAVASDTWKDLSLAGSATASTPASHLTFAIPYQPGTMRRSG